MHGKIKSFSGTAVGYIRCSTSGQATDGVSIQTQRARIQAAATLKGLELIGLYEDAGISGASVIKRPGLQDALDAACKHRSALVVYSLSRLARSTKDAIAISEKLEKAGADLVSLTESIDTTSAAGKMIFRVLAVLAEFERDVISERTRAAMGYKRSQRLRISRHTPFGWRLRNGALTPHLPEQSTLTKIRQMRQRGRSLRQICRYLTQKGVRPKAGGAAWYPATVNNILKRPTN